MGEEDVLFSGKLLSLQDFDTSVKSGGEEVLKSPAFWDIDIVQGGFSS